MQEARNQRDKFDAVVAGVKPVLDCIDPEVAPQPDGIVTTTTHALTMVRSHYPTTDLQTIGARFIEGMGEAEHQQLEDEVEDAAKKLAGDIDLFGETDGDGEAR